MKYTLRDYQQRASDAAVNYFTSNTKGNGLLILPTGAGKSLVIADIASKIDEPLIVLHMMIPPVGGMRQRRFQQRYVFEGIAQLAAKCLHSQTFFCI